jgi:hypothetical protein
MTIELVVNPIDEIASKSKTLFPYWGFTSLFGAPSAPAYTRADHRWPARPDQAA